MSIYIHVYRQLNFRVVCVCFIHDLARTPAFGLALALTIALAIDHMNSSAFVFAPTPLIFLFTHILPLSYFVDWHSIIFSNVSLIAMTRTCIRVCQQFKVAACVCEKLCRELSENAKLLSPKSLTLETTAFRTASSGRHYH